MISNEEWEVVQKKYGSLIYMIAHRIGGDKITNDFDDSVQEIRMSAMDAIRTYRKKTDVPFAKFFITKDFDKYIKTCLWNRKNSNGTMIQKKAIVRNTISLNTHDELFMADDSNCGDKTQTMRQHDSTLISDATSGIEEMFKSFNDVNMDTDTRSIVSLIEADGKMIKPNGNLNINRIARTLGKKKHQIKYIVERLQTQLKDYNGN
tara:strand:+ start:114 stop:731 length:618 start_codon:yes stop_codon:yes gene_type:complete